MREGRSEKNILLGNGINAHLGIKDMGTQDIAKRFLHVLKNTEVFWGKIFNVNLDIAMLDKEFINAKKQGIESLANLLYDYVVHESRQNLSNLEIRHLLDLIVCCAITAIFYYKDKKLGGIYQDNYIPDFSRYKNIFTLNYAEFWDASEECIYLHGKYDLQSTKENGKEVLHYCTSMLTFDGKDEVMKYLNNRYNMCKLEVENIVFSPELFHNKSKTINLTAFPSKNLFPSQFLYPKKEKKLYKEIIERGVRQIEIFGMSPYGDEELIQLLKTLEKIQIYIYGINSTDKVLNHNAKIEIQDWKARFGCLNQKKIEFRDSLDIIS